MYVAKTKVLISYAVTVQLICAFVFAYAKHWFSLDAAHIICFVRNLSSGFPTRFITNCAVQPEKMARGLKFWIY